MQTFRLKVDADGLVRVPDARPGQTVIVQVDDMAHPDSHLTLATVKTPEERATMIARLQSIAHDLHQELLSAGANADLDLYGKDGLPA